MVEASHLGFLSFRDSVSELTKSNSIVHLEGLDLGFL